MLKCLNYYKKGGEFMKKIRKIDIRILGAIGLSALILGGCSLLPGGATPTPQAQPAAPTSSAEPAAEGKTGTSLDALMSAVEVTYKSGIFSPNPVTIKVGQGVRFVNAGPGLMWVASNPHPTHTDYPGFDSLKGVEVGQSYTFVFSKVGTWKYHNHPNPSETGTVVVTER